MVAEERNQRIDIFLWIQRLRFAMPCPFKLPDGLMLPGRLDERFLCLRWDQWIFQTKHHQQRTWCNLGDPLPGDMAGETPPETEFREPQR